jgi:LuxR family transcriptional regulator, quorum-sensing system regulator SdiA
MMPSVSALESLAPAGFYVAIRVGFAFPLVEHNHLPEAWVREYAVSGFLVHDPMMAWAYRNCGIVRCDALRADDAQGVLEFARARGLIYGAAASHVDDGDAGQRSLGIFFRSDRHFTCGELDVLLATLRSCHREHAPPRNLTRAEVETLGLVKNGMLMKEIANALGVSESAIKQRLQSARRKLKAKTGSQAAARATMLGMI